MFLIFITRINYLIYITAAFPGRWMEILGSGHLRPIWPKGLIRGLGVWWFSGSIKDEEGALGKGRNMINVVEIKSESVQSNYANMQTTENVVYFSTKIIEAQNQNIPPRMSDPEMLIPDG